jgi:NADP-dependent aldehyde dehydrogenase
MRTAADNIEALGDVLYDRLTLETGLPKARAEGETARTVAQFRMFADLTEEGRWRCATIDTADAQRKPTPRLDQRMQKIGIGPVAVFGSSNFPMLYSVAGGDTASALAAGCPVVVKAHGSHMGVSELVGRAIQKAVAHHGLPEGVFSLLIGAGNELGEALVDHHLIQAVGFTGSQGGGMALVRRGLARPQPIPVFAEMTSINPTFLLPSAQASRAAEFATRFTQQMTAGVGQMCLKPGMILALDGASYDVLRKTLSAEISPITTARSPTRSAATRLRFWWGEVPLRSPVRGRAISSKSMRRTCSTTWTSPRKCLVPRQCSCAAPIFARCWSLRRA